MPNEAHVRSATPFRDNFDPTCSRKLRASVFTFDVHTPGIDGKIREDQVELAFSGLEEVTLNHGHFMLDGVSAHIFLSIIDRIGIFVDGEDLFRPAAKCGEDRQDTATGSQIKDTLILRWRHEPSHHAG